MGKLVVGKAIPTADVTLSEALQTIFSFLDKCDGGTSYLIMPDGTKLKTDWGYVYEGLELLREYAMKEGKDG